MKAGKDEQATIILQTQEKQRNQGLLEEHIPPGSLFSKDRIMATPEGIIIPAHL